MAENLVTVRVRTWTSPDEQEETLLLIPRALHEMLVAFVDGRIPNDPEHASLVLDGRTPIATREERSAVAGRIANERGTPAPVTTWTTVAY